MLTIHYPTYISIYARQLLTIPAVKALPHGSEYTNTFDFTPTSPWCAYSVQKGNLKCVRPQLFLSLIIIQIYMIYVNNVA